MFITILLSFVECEDGFYGDNCEEECNCGPMGHCDPITGKCSCRLGWYGATCEDSCPAGKFGPNCVHSCHCQNKASCDSVTGCCQCKPGYYGQRCELGKPLFLKVCFKTKNSLYSKLTDI